MTECVIERMACGNEEEGRCVEEDLVKSFFPSLFDSDSDSEDLYCLQSHQSSKTDESTTVLAQLGPWRTASNSSKAVSDLSSPATKANSTSLLHLSRKLEALADPGSPLSQENSAHTIFQAGALEHSSSTGDQSPFHSVLSQASSSSIFDVDSLEASPLKKRKVEWPPGHTEAPLPEVLGQAAAREACHGLRPAVSIQPGFPRQSNVSLAYQGSLGRPLCLAGGITTGVPIDSCPLTTPKASLGRSSSAHVSTGYSNVWAGHAPHSQPMHQRPQGQLLSNWCSTSAMIPTTTTATAMIAPTTSLHTTPLQNTKTPPEGSEKIAAALAEISKAPMGMSPLGLKLDRVAVMHQLSAMGMKVTGI